MHSKRILDLNVTSSILLSPSEVSIIGKDFYPSPKMFLKSPSGRHYVGNLRLEQRKSQGRQCEAHADCKCYSAHQLVFTI